ncbi:methylated-DNA--protein-cysteine methyltransferase [Actinorhabdospora filicis]|uniref:methylated-DNA--[protein]-cysteine S-methyltransferase n=1 Tax=Actinorhabdospora filicis TaxID=1785913 RepID=A0A9W6SKV2_9ACTN|nr:MGMT family protein [Actinorhabdospora filicis]GLZ78854.1 methylated-DNA--protein-cysteine methyltransferase [Actinorhabdospora filicis]
MPLDDLEQALAGLAAAPPARVFDRITARWTRATSPLGDVDVAYTEHGVAWLRPAALGTLAEEFKARFARPLLRTDHPPAALTDALATGDGGGLDYDLTWLTPFASSVLSAARTIPRGQVRPYTWIAERIGNPKAVRAVGSALGHNPVPLLIPCHRIVRADGLGQYIFGVDAKTTLLRGEGAIE